MESAPVDAERVVHELLDALETLAKKRRLTALWLANSQNKSRRSKAPRVQSPQASKLNQARTE